MERLFWAEDLSKLFSLRGRRVFGTGGRWIHAVDRVSFHVSKGETLGIVGESGSGKTTLARLMLKLIAPSGGKLFFDGRDVTRLAGSQMKRLRRRIQMIFQDPYSSLDPRQVVLDIIAEPLKVHGICDAESMEKKVREILELVELPGSEDFLWKLPDELSGGQRQRVGIARALVVGPELIVADEPVSMLDASVKAAVASLLLELKRKKRLTYVFITHEVGLAYHLCDRIAVMFMGKIVELGPAESIVNVPCHPYTRMLMEATPPLVPDENWQRSLPALETEGPVESTEGCGFSARCPDTTGSCDTSRPELIEVENNHFVRCHRGGARSSGGGFSPRRA